MIKKLALLLWYRCNNNCVFCYCGDKKDKWEMSTQQAKEELESGRERGCSFVDFNGGEPSMRKDIMELVAHAKSLGYKTIAMTTNGRMFSYKNFCHTITAAGLNHVIFSLHGHTPELHDSLTRTKDSYKQVTAGMKNIREANPSIYICTNTVINKKNFMYLPEIAKHNIALGADGCEFIFIHPRGNALKNFDDIVPTLTDIVPYVGKVIQTGKSLGIGHLAVRYVPVCCVPGNVTDISEIKARSNLREQHVGPEFRDLNVEKGRAEVGRVKGPSCRDCIHDDICEGIFKEYADRRGLGELKPVKEEHK